MSYERVFPSTILPLLTTTTQNYASSAAIEYNTVTEISRVKCVSVFRSVRKIAKPTISFVMSVCPSVRLSVRMEELCSHWTDLHEILYLSVFRKYVQKIHVSLKSG